MVDGAALISYLQAALTHAEVHCVHVDVAWEWFLFGRYCHICVFVLEDGDLDFDFLASSLPDGLDEASESRVSVDGLVDHKL